MIRYVSEPQHHNGQVDVCNEPGCGFESSHAAPTDHYILKHLEESGHTNATVYNDRAYDKMIRELSDG